MNPITSTPLFFLGIDVGKTELFCHIISAQKPNKTDSEMFENSIPGLKKLIQWLNKNANISQTLICMEQTGCYSKLPSETLFKTKQMGVYVVNPRRVKAFNDSKLRRSKTDKADAKSIAKFIKREYDELLPWKPQSKHQQRIKALSRQAQSLSKELGKLKVQIQSSTDDQVHKSINRVIKFFTAEIKKVREQIQKLIIKDTETNTKLELLCSIPGIGPIIGQTLVAELPAIEDFDSARQMAAWAGVTPRHSESGTSGKAKTPISKVGSPQLRKALFLPAMTAMQHNPLIKEFSERLKANGKKPKEVVIASTRKLIHLSYGVLKSGQPFNPNHLNPNTKKQPLTEAVQ